MKLSETKSPFYTPLRDHVFLGPVAKKPSDSDMQMSVGGTANVIYIRI
jgi:hypothetical protein